MTAIPLEQAQRIADATLDHARTIGCHPMTVAVVDVAAAPHVVKREDGSGTIRHRIAVAKCAGALGLGVPTRVIAQLAEQRPRFVDAVAALDGVEVVPTAGGVLVRDAQGQLLGAVGVSGDLPERDEECAVAGIESVGLVADIGA